MFDISNIKIDIPKDVQDIMNTLRDAGFEAYIVGGCVRDSILGKVPGDWDITTSALPMEVKGLFGNTVDTGIQHGTVMVIRHGCGYEITTYRIDGQYNDSRHPEKVEFTPSLEEDLKRRDFTINAFAYNPERGVVDLFDGISDLNNGLIRCVGDPFRRFDEDALRIMRAVRFSSQLSFKIEEQTEKAISHFADRLANISRERIRVEFEKTLCSPNPSYVDEYARLGLGGDIIRSYADRCFDKSSEALYPRMTGNDLKILRMAAFCKNLTPDEAREIIRDLTFDNRTRDLTAAVLKYKDEPMPNDRVQIKKALGEMGLEVFGLVQEYRKAAGTYDAAAAETAEDILKSGEPYMVSHLAVSGNDLMAAGVPRGGQVGDCLDVLLDAVIHEPGLNTKETLLRKVKESL